VPGGGRPPRRRCPRLGGPQAPSYCEVPRDRRRGGLKPSCLAGGARTERPASGGGGSPCSEVFSACRPESSLDRTLSRAATCCPPPGSQLARCSLAVSVRGDVDLPRVPVTIGSSPSGSTCWVPSANCSPAAMLMSLGSVSLASSASSAVAAVWDRVLSWARFAWWGWCRDRPQLSTWWLRA